MAGVQASAALGRGKQRRVFIGEIIIAEEERRRLGEITSNTQHTLSTHTTYTPHRHARFLPYSRDMRGRA